MWVYQQVCVKTQYILKKNQKYLRGDNTGKNESFLKEINGKDCHMGVTPEWMPRTKPQPNNVENLIDIIPMRGCALLAAANVSDNCKNVLMPYAVKYASSKLTANLVCATSIVILFFFVYQMYY